MCCRIWGRRGLAARTIEVSNDERSHCARFSGHKMQSELSRTLGDMKHIPATSSRIIVIGSGCAGKSTFATHLASAIGCLRIELDELFWSPNWTPKPQTEFLRLVAAAAAKETWVAAGNYSSARSVLWPINCTP